MDASGNRIQGGKRPAAPDVQAMFLRPAGYDYGYATFYLPGARQERERVFHPAGSVVVSLAFLAGKRNSTGC